MRRNALLLAATAVASFAIAFAPVYAQGTGATGNENAGGDLPGSPGAIGTPQQGATGTTAQGGTAATLPGGTGTGGAAAQDQAAFQTAEYRALVAALPMARTTLSQVISQLVTGRAVVTEAKYEMEDGVLFVGVYTSQMGLGVPAQDNIFDEFKGNATTAQYMPAQEVFTDRVHIARSASYQTLLSLTRLTIPQMIMRVEATGARVISVKAKVVAGRAVFEVVTVSGAAARVTYYDLVTGMAV